MITVTMVNYLLLAQSYSYLTGMSTF